jgi:hypothetical protein
MEELQVVVGLANDAASFKEQFQTAIAGHGFDWNQYVESVIHSTDFLNVLVGCGFFKTLVFRFAITTKNSTVPVG